MAVHVRDHNNVTQEYPDADRWSVSSRPEVPLLLTIHDEEGNILAHYHPSVWSCVELVKEDDNE